MKIKIHPLFGVLVVVTIIFGGASSMLWTFLAVLLHETGHYLMARTRGYVMGSVVLMPFGAEMSAKENFDSKSSVLIGLAGPLTNIILALVTVGIWWVFPSAYTVTKPFLNANISMAFFNLLPVYPLDGARVLVGLSKNKLKALKWLKIFGIVVSVCALALFVVSCFITPNFTFAVVAIFIFYGAITDRAEENYVSIFSSISKDYTLGVEKKKILISKDVPLQRLLRFSGQNSMVTFEVVDMGGLTIDESKLKDLCLVYKMSTPIGKILGSKNDANPTNEWAKSCNTTSKNRLKNSRKHSLFQEEKEQKTKNK
jgi:stage IV sporulation protein FB